jgi:hypothetical protein
MKLKASGVNKAHLVVASNSPDKPCPYVEFEPDDFYDGVVMSMEEADQIIEMLISLEDYVEDYEREFVFNYRHALAERYKAALKED